MSDDRVLARRVCGLAATCVGAIAAVGWLLGGLDHALGALAGGVITIGNFLWLHWTARMATGRVTGGSRGPLRTAVWLGASGVRFGAVALALGVAVTQGWLGLGGLIVALTALPAAVVAEGLRVARIS